ncbi:MAG: LysE family transporter [Hyphomicrobiaceae bacterium]|nr:LysE family transporter [Hyphomicrobiaceae bacterium]
MDILPNPLVIPAGIAIGILIAAPVGPVNVLCIHRALHRGVWAGIVAGSGAVLADALIALSAALGVGAISGAVKYHRTAIQLVGGLALLAFGVHLYRTAPGAIDDVEDGKPPRLADYVWDFSQSFVLTVTNPGAVLGLFAIFGGIGTFVELNGSLDAIVLVAAIVGGSLAWWVFLSATVNWIKHRLDVSALTRINRIAGIFLVGFGLLLIGQLAAKLARALASGM